MNSLKSKILISLIRNRHIFNGKIRRPIIDETFDVDSFRKSITESSLKMEKIPSAISIEKLKIGSIDGEYIIPEGAPVDKILMYVHGGGFISGDCDSHRMHVVKFAEKIKIKVLLFNYRLAPEYPYPAASDDCMEVYQYLLNGYEEDNIFLGGESAGGTLVLSLLNQIKMMGIEMPKAAFSISPVTDLSCKAKSFEYNAKKDIAPYNSWRVWTDMYIGDAPTNDPVLSPFFGDPTGFPPLLICIGSYEIHLDDAKAYSEKAKECGVEIEYRCWEGMVHAFPILAPLFKEAVEAHDWTCNFIKDKI